jgi:hypothetical protein
MEVAAGEVEALVLVNGLVVDRGAEGKLVTMYVKIKEGDMGGRMPR